MRLNEADEKDFERIDKFTEKFFNACKQLKDKEEKPEYCMGIKFQAKTLPSKSSKAGRADTARMEKYCGIILLLKQPFPFYGKRGRRPGRSKAPNAR